GGRARTRSLRPCGLLRRGRARTRSALAGGGPRLPGERSCRSGRASLATQGAAHRPRPPRRRLLPRAAARELPLRAASRPGGRRALRGRLQTDPGATRLREPDRDRLLGRAGAMLSLTHVVDLLADELPGLRRPGLPL